MARATSQRLSQESVSTFIDKHKLPFDKIKQPITEGGELLVREIGGKLQPMRMLKQVRRYVVSNVYCDAGIAGIIRLR